MKKSIFSRVSAALIGAMLFTASPVSAAHLAGNQNNGSIYFQSGQNAGNWKDPVYSRRHDDRLRYKHFDRAICHPREAIYKAQRFGLRNAEINRINNQLIVVSGRKHGHRLIVGMERFSRNCDIVFVRRNHRDTYR